MRALSVLITLTIASSVLTAPVIDKRQASCSTFGAWACVGQVLSQCNYGANNALVLSPVQTCAAGLACVTGAYTGCLAAPASSAVPPASTSSAARPSSTASSSAISLSVKPSTTSLKSSSSGLTTSAARSSTTSVAPSTTQGPSPSTSSVLATTGTTSGPSAGQSCPVFAAYACDSSNNLLQCGFSGGNVWGVAANCAAQNTICQVTGTSGNCVVPPPATGTPSPTVVPVPPPNLSGKAKKVVYNDQTQYVSGSAYPASLGVPGYASTTYNVFNLAFWLRAGAYDAAYYWTQLDVNTRQSYVNAWHNAGQAVMISAFGATDFPTGADPVATAQNLAKFVIQYQFDGADIDWEDNAAMENGTGEAWLVSFTTELRKQLPSPRYLISHAPQAPYFFGDKKKYPNGAYLTVDKEVGNLIDWYNVQFYNQGNTDYATCDGLLNTSVGSFPNSALFQISASGVPLNKIVIGKPITSAGATNTGYMAPSLLASCVAQAKAKGWDAGVMGWQISLDQPLGSWMATVGASL
ncbi:glycoside hydrolase superfamily [Chytriomyces sp. MP71]|nr:glycoside hydrolase superfamily [Chytriomyces sp. MP71]